MSRYIDEKKDQIDCMVIKYMKKFDIPGVSVSVFREGEFDTLSYGYSNRSKKERITQESYFELGSVSKSYTAAAVFLCEEKGLLSIEDSVTKYIPWLHIWDEKKEKNVAPDMRISDFLYHTTGFHVSTLQLIEEEKSDDALRKTVEALNNITTILHPGEQFNYATINYDVLGFIIECVSGKSYEDFMEKELLHPLGLYHTYVGWDGVLTKSIGYKRSVFHAVPYRAPVFRGNAPAGYLVSNALDIGKWMEIQLNYKYLPEPFDKVIEKCQKPNCKVAPFFRYYYAGGWYVSITKTRMFHAGDAPNYSSMVVFNKKKNIGVGVLVNIDVPITEYIGNAIMKILENIEVKEYEITQNEKCHKRFQAITVFGTLLWPFLLCNRPIISIFLIPFCILFLGVLIFSMREYYRYTVQMGLEKVNIKTRNLWSPYSYIIGKAVGFVTALSIVVRYLFFMLFD